MRLAVPPIALPRSPSDSGNAECLDPVLAGQQFDRACPVGALHAAVEAKGVEDAAVNARIRVADRIRLHPASPAPTCSQAGRLQPTQLHTASPITRSRSLAVAASRSVSAIAGKQQRLPGIRQRRAQARHSCRKNLHVLRFKSTIAVASRIGWNPSKEPERDAR